jgi:DNA-binding response OmpR family regulator
VESTAAQGTTFIVRLPFELVSEQTPEEVEYETNVLPMTMQSTASAFEAEALAGEALGTKPKENSFGQVLVIEDQADLRKFISGCLAQEYQVLEAADGVAGYTIAQETMPDLIISDVMMPGMNGITLCEKLKTEERTSHIPVILLTAKADAESKLQGLETGAEEYLTKPFHLRELQLRVRNLLESRQKLQQHLSKRLFSNTHFSNSHGVAPVAVKVSSADERFLKNALAIAEENISNAGFDVESFCRQIGMSRTHLHRKLTALTGQSTSEFIKLIRLKRAASLLRQQHGNVSEIAFLVGFSSQNYFTKCFKEHYGQTPSEYLRNHPLANSPQV